MTSCISQHNQEGQESFVASILRPFRSSCFPSGDAYLYLKVQLFLFCTSVLPKMEYLILIIILENCALLCLFLSFP